jgi:hypothetical protein
MWHNHSSDLLFSTDLTGDVQSGSGAEEAASSGGGSAAIDLVDSKVSALSAVALAQRALVPSLEMLHAQAQALEQEANGAWVCGIGCDRL